LYASGLWWQICRETLSLIFLEWLGNISLMIDDVHSDSDDSTTGVHSEQTDRPLSSRKLVTAAGSSANAEFITLELRRPSPPPKPEALQETLPASQARRKPPACVVGKESGVVLKRWGPALVGAVICSLLLQE